MEFNSEERRYYTTYLSKNQHHNLAKRMPSEEQWLTPRPARKRKNGLRWTVLSIIIVLVLLIGAYYSLRLMMTMPGDGGTELEQEVPMHRY